MKNAKTIDRFSQGANARIKTAKLKNECIKEITDLKKPSWNEEETQLSKDVLIPEKDLNTFMQDPNGGKNLNWNNYFQDIEKNREYKGQWTQDRKEWKGIGIIKFKD